MDYRITIIINRQSPSCAYLEKEIKFNISEDKEIKYRWKLKRLVFIKGEIKACEGEIVIEYR